MKFEKPEIKRILLAIDLSENAYRAFEYAAILANSHEAHITILHVLEKMPPKVELLVLLFEGHQNVKELNEKTEADILDKTKSFIEHFCADFNCQFPSCRLMVDAIIVEEGSPAKRILHHARSGHDLLVMGSRGFGMFQSLRMGSTSQSVLRQCQIPVLIIPSKTG